MRPTLIRLAPDDYDRLQWLQKRGWGKTTAGILRAILHHVWLSERRRLARKRGGNT